MALTHSHYLRYRRGGNVYTKYGNTTKQTTPSIAFRAGGKTYYIPLSRANPTASLPIGVRYNNNTYRIGTASATLTVPQMVKSGSFVVGTESLLFGGFSLSNGGFDQSWKLTVKVYNIAQNEIPSKYVKINTYSYSASTTSSSSPIVMTSQGQMEIRYCKIVITVFNTTYISDFIDLRTTTSGSLTVT